MDPNLVIIQIVHDVRSPSANYFIYNLKGLFAYYYGEAYDKDWVKSKRKDIPTCVEFKFDKKYLKRKNVLIRI